MIDEDMTETDLEINMITEHVQSLKRVENMPVSKSLYIKDVSFLLEVIENLRIYGQIDTPRIEGLLKYE